MNISNKKKLRLEQTTMGSSSVGAGGHIDLALGTFDRPGPNPKKDMENAIVPTEMVATQLATERPPIEDDDYVPSSIVELAKAASEMAKLVPPEQVKKFYLKMKELADECVERAEITVLDGNDMMESKNIKVVKMIREALDDLDSPIPGIDLNKTLATLPDIIKAHPEEFEDIAPHRRYSAAMDTLKTGTGKLEAMLAVVPESEIDKLHNVAKDEYIDLFEEVVGDDVDLEDIADLKKLSADALYEMSDTYKFFFKAAFVLPTMDKYNKLYKKITAQTYADIQTQLKTVGVPAAAETAVIFQMLGFSKRDPAAIKEKYVKAANAGEIKSTEVEMQYKRLMSQYAHIASNARSKMLDARGNAASKFVNDSLDAYSKMSLDDRKDLIIQAFEKMD